jgi:hypothetical protein
MEAVRFMLRFQSQNDAGKDAMAKENNGKTIDWDLMIDLNGGMSHGQVILDCSPPYFQHWNHNLPISLLVTVDPSSESVALSLGDETLVRVRAEIRISSGTVYLENAKVEPVKQPE